MAMQHVDRVSLGEDHCRSGSILEEDVNEVLGQHSCPDARSLLAEGELVVVGEPDADADVV